MNKIKYSELPALKLLVLVLSGLIAGSFVSWSLELLLLTLSLVLIFSVSAYKIKFYNLCFVLLAFSSGLILSYNLNNKIIGRKNTLEPEFPAVFTGEIDKILLKDENYTRLLCEGSFDAQPLPGLSDERVILSVIQKKEKKINLYSGEKIYTSCIARIPANKFLPQDFDEIAYARVNNASWFARTGSENVAILSESIGLNYFREKLTEKLQSIIYTLFNTDTKGVAYALVTGDQTKISSETKLSYTLSGTIHVLAVSGLHVGIISGLIFTILGFVRNRWVKFVIFSILLSFYVFFTGWQPSAIRAGVMALCIMFVYCIERRYNILNALSFAILLIVIFTPNIIFSPGFQMSSMSILGIALFFSPIYKRISSLNKKKNEFISFIFSSFALTISASVIVSPLVAYYFGTYSFVAPLANLFIVPLTSLSLIFLIFSIGFVFVIPYLAILYAKSAEFLILLSNRITEYSSNVTLSYVKSENIYLVAILISIGLIYLLFSKNIRQFLFRFSCSTISIFLLIIIFNDTFDSNIKIIPRTYVVATYIKLDKNRTFVLLSDRKPYYKPYRDFTLEKNLIEYNSSLILGITGISSMAIPDEVKKQRKIICMEFNIPMQERINKIISPNEFLPQIIDIRNY